MRTVNFSVLLLCLIFTACSNSSDKNTDGNTTANDTSATAPLAGTEDTATEPGVDSSDTDKIPVDTENIQTPQGYEPLGAAKGDLDKDHAAEKVIVYNTAQQTDLGTERELHIYKQKNGGWELWHKSSGAVLPSENGGVMGDPFEEVKVENGSLVFSHFGGSRQKWHYTHRFRYQHGGWQLIGATVSNGAPCDYYEDFDYNLSTGKISYKKTTENCEQSEDNPITKTVQKAFTSKLKTLPGMDGFRPGETKVDLPKTDIEFYF